MSGGIIFGDFPEKKSKIEYFFNQHKLERNAACERRGWHQININYRNPLFAKCQLQEGSYKKSLKLFITRF